MDWSARLYVIALEVGGTLWPGLHFTTLEYPEVITTDNGSEFAGIALGRWVYNNNVWIDFIKPGKPIQNALIRVMGTSHLFFILPRSSSIA